MKYVDRTGVSAPASLTGIDSAGHRELLRARIHFSSASTNGKSFPFKAYKSQDVRDALKKLFAGKCAYCESPISATAPLEVEHYRPKGGVEEAPEHPGYWWLGSAWENLLPSCIDCNRRRRHRIAALGMTLDALVRAARNTLCGKHQSFPIAAQRARTETDDLSLELPLLINPCELDPTPHLKWVLDDHLSIVSGVDEAGETTIHLFGLNRQGLVEERTKQLLRMKADLADARERLDMATRLTGVAREELISSAMTFLERMRIDHGSSYSALAQSYWDSAMRELEQRYASLLTTPA